MKYPCSTMALIGMGLIVLPLGGLGTPVALAQQVPSEVRSHPAISAKSGAVNPIPARITSTFPIAQKNAQHQLFVNPNTGNDSHNGSAQAPFKTLTQALRRALPNTVIQLAPGTYSAETGEVFPLELKPSVIVVGDPATQGRNVTVRGGGIFISPTFARQDITILGANSAALAGVTVTNPNFRGYGLWIESSSPVVADNTFTGNTHDGISVVGKSAPLIRNNTFTRNGANGMTIYGTSNPEVLDNVFENTGFGVNVAQKATPLIRGNRIIRNLDGVVVQASAAPILRNNQIEGNTRDGLVAIASAVPNLGTPQDAGNNVFRNNGRHDINQASSQIVPSFGNQVTQSRTTGQLDWQGAVAVNPPPPSNPSNNTHRPLPPLPPRNNTNRPLPPSSNPNPNPPSAAIPIPVPSPGGITNRLPVNPNPLPPPPQPRNVPPVNTVRPPSVSDRVPVLGPLPVPNGNAPIGNAGEIGTIRVSGNPRLHTPGTPPPPPTRGEVLGLRYRVIVEAPSSREQARVRAIAPGAFRTTVNGRSVMQAGAFNTREKADELLQSLTRQGLRANLEDY